MSSGLIPSFGASSIRDYVTKKEKFVGVVGTGVIGAALFFWLGPHVMPSVVSTLGMLNSAVSYTTALAVKGVLLVGAGYALTNKRTWTIGWHVFNMFTRAMSKGLRMVDRVGRIRAYTNEYLAMKMQKVIASVAVVVRERMLTEKKISEYEDRIAEALKDAQNLQRVGVRQEKWINMEHRQEFQKLSMKIKMWQDSNERFKKLLGRMKLQEAVLKKLQQGFELWIDVLRTKVDVLVAEYEANKGAAEATAAVSDTVGESDDQTRFFLDGMEELEEMSAQYAATVDVIIDTLPELTKKMDRDGEMAELNVLDQLRELDLSAGAMLEGAQRLQDKMLSHPTSDMPTRPHSVSSETSGGSQVRTRSLLGE